MESQGSGLDMDIGSDSDQDQMEVTQDLLATPSTSTASDAKLVEASVEMEVDDGGIHAAPASVTIPAPAAATQEPTPQGSPDMAFLNSHAGDTFHSPPADSSSRGIRSATPELFTDNVPMRHALELILANPQHIEGTRSIFGPDMRVVALRRGGLVPDTIDIDFTVDNNHFRELKSWNERHDAFAK